MDDDPLKIRVADPSVASRANAKRTSSSLWIVATVAALLVVGAGIAYSVLPGNEPKPTADESAETVAPVAADSTTVIEKPTTSTRFADDGTSMWVSPTAGPPLDCSYLLPGTQLVLHVRVADLLTHDEGEKVRAALGPWGEQAIAWLTSSTGVQLDSIETLLLGIRVARNGNLEFTVRLRTKELVSNELVGANCFVPTAGEGRVVVWCSGSALAELKQLAGEPPLFSRELQRVLDRTDTDRTVTLAFAGKFLQISGEKLVRGSGEKLRTALVDFLGDEATASALSLHWANNFFFELQSTVALNQRPHRFAQSLEQRVAEVSEDVENEIFARPLPTYGRKVLARMPAMLRKLDNYTRGGEADKLSLLRCYLPVNAGHNLLMASELLLNLDPMSTAGGTDSNAPGATAQATDQQPNTLEARLKQQTSLVFPKETLQKALEILSEDLGVPIQIAGRDLQLEGITKNQSLAIELRDRPAAEILLEVILRANPDRTASGPTDTKQKLVYVIRQPSDSQPGAIVVTTRSAAARRGEKLPAVFEPAAR